MLLEFVSGKSKQINFRFLNNFFYPTILTSVKEEYSLFSEIIVGIATKM